MLGIAQTPSTRIGSKGVFCLSAASVALLGTLVLVGSARAASPASEEATGLGTAETISNEASKPGPGEPAAEGDPKPIGEQTPKPITEETPKPIAEETPKPITEETPKPIAEETPKPIIEETPKPIAEETPKPIAEGTVKPTTESAAEEPQKPALSATPDTQENVPPPANVGGEVAPGAASDLIGSLATAYTVGGPGGAAPSSKARHGSAGTSTATITGQRPQSLSCALSGLQENAAEDCGVGVFGVQRLLAPAAIGFETTDASLVAATAEPPSGGGGGGSAVGSRPVGPSPGPAPSGSSGASAVGGAGVALSGFLTLAGLLGLAAPRAMRRLRLSCRPWLTACFVLIPERPG
jgi:outer membrane biosynthesis protein TonB